MNVDGIIREIITGLSALRQSFGPAVQKIYKLKKEPALHG